MKKSLYHILLLALLVAFSCQKKKYPKPAEVNDSVFSAKLLVNGQSLEIITGKNDYYMYSSNSMDSSNVVNLIGEYKQVGCSNCPNSLRIQINDSKVSLPTDAIDIDNALRLKDYEFLSGTNDFGYSVNFASSFNKTISSVFWDFGDGTTSTDLNPVHIFKAGKYQVSLVIKAPDMSQSAVVNTLSLNFADNLNAYVTSSANSNTVSFNAHVSGGKAPYTYSWEFGDGSISNGTATISHYYALSGGYGARLKVKDANGKVVGCAYNVVVGNDISACATNISFSNITAVSKRFGLSKVSVSYTDVNGITYTSDNAAQPNSSNLRILSVEEFVRNEKNEAVKKVKLKFNCTVYNGTQSIFLEGAEVLIGLSYR